LHNKLSADIIPMIKNILKKQWPLLGLGMLLACVAFYLIRSHKKDVKKSGTEEVVAEQGLKIHDFSFNQDNPEKGMTWVLNAKEMSASADNKFITFDAFRIKITPKERPFFELSGDKGTYSRDSGEIKLWGNLEGLSQDGYRIISEEILINEKEKQVSTDKPVKILGASFAVDGQGLLADLEHEKIRVLSNVTTVIKLDGLTL
jgi:LPS export ABC transporter protein LptC